ncbi:MAG: hypothetical protein AAF789_12925, partial [Bacteroidota bacterium]
ACQAENVGPLYHLRRKVVKSLSPFLRQANYLFSFELAIALQGRFSLGFIAATVLLMLSLLESWLVMRPYDLAWGVSVSTLMLIGWVLEIMILKETMFATEIALYRNQGQWEELKSFYKARAEMEAFKKALSSGNMPILPDESSNPKPEELGKKTALSLKRAGRLRGNAFYGVTLDPEDPFLQRNLSRIEGRFRKRYFESLTKNENRIAMGKPPHTATLRSLAQNKDRFEQVRLIRHELLGEELCFDMKKRPKASRRGEKC